ncbi:hypothetical protein MMC30_004139 [Trapelia coarctata]|nr:hypothetical protein [Trapelia coarctata]
MSFFQATEKDLRSTLPPSSLQSMPSPVSPLRNALQTLWSLTKDDIPTFLLPDTLFGLLSALAGPILTTQPTSSPFRILQRLPLPLTFTFLNLLVFDLANQRLSAAEDTLNKPWRPIPSGRLTPLQMRRWLLAAAPVLLAVTYALDAWRETALLLVLTWLYNDLGGGDENFVVRNLLLGAAFALYHIGALRVACGEGYEISAYGMGWIAQISGVIFSTMQVQDLKDQAGDHARGRRTAPLVLGERVARWTVAGPVVGWSVLCPLYLGVRWAVFALPVSLGVVIAVRVTKLKEVRDDKVTWFFWAGWLSCLYSLPLMRYCEGLSGVF